MSSVSGRVTMLQTDVCLRVETVADVEDAIRLMMYGYHVVALPVAGQLASIYKPIRMYFCNDFKWMRSSTWIIHVRDSYASLAQAVAEILRNRDLDRDLYLDVPEHRTDMREALAGVVRLLNLRAHRLLTVCDIADLLEWLLIAAPASARLDCQIPYGHPSWGFFIRRATDTAELADHRPVASIRASRTALCNVPMNDADRDAVAAYKAASPHSVCVVDGTQVSGWLTHGIALSFDKAVALPAYGYRPRIALDLSGLSENEQWETVQSVARDQMAANRGPPSGLQPAWLDSYRVRHLVTIAIPGRTIDHDHHAGYARKKLADKLGWMQPDPQLPSAPVTISG